MVRVFPVLLVLVALLVALIDCLSSENHEIRGLPKGLWVIIILLFPLFGALAWFFAGRPVTVHEPAAAVAERPSSRGSGRQIAPDDDADFLRGLNQTRSRDDEELLRRWEEDLRRREDELKHRDDKEDL